MIQAKAHYACLAVIELALQSEGDRPLSLREISERHGIPHPFLVQIVQQLKVAGLVNSTRGSHGGYRLGRSPDAITLLDIVEALGCDAPSNTVTQNDHLANHELHRVWKQANSAYSAILARTRVSDLVRRCETSRQPMFHI